MITIEPINADQQQQVIRRVGELLQHCAQRLDHDFKPIECRFDLRGRSSGMYVIKNRQRYLRFNPFIFAKYFEDSLATTVPHEVAHYVADILFGFRHIRPHGEEWRDIMRLLGAEPRVTGNYDLTGLPVRQQRRFDYRCACMTHSLTTVRHNRIRRGQSEYVCRKCGEHLRRESTSLA
ncbi:MAG TPA: metallopeptidase (SprT family) [Gammaproteobacteria bacterium]|nr:metallopeptidase (SprT family) [Gammaproteobacteria bacterium]